jgi:hypothetical protein
MTAIYAALLDSEKFKRWWAFIGMVGITVVFLFYAAMQRFEGYSRMSIPAIEGLKGWVISIVGTIVFIVAMTWGPRSKEHAWSRRIFWVVYWAVGGVITSLLVLAGIDAFFGIGSWLLLSMAVASDPVVVDAVVNFSAPPRRGSLQDRDFNLVIHEALWNDGAAFVLLLLFSRTSSIDVTLSLIVTAVAVGFGLGFLLYWMRKEVLFRFPLLVEFIVMIGTLQVAIHFEEALHTTGVLMAVVAGTVLNIKEEPLDAHRTHQVHQLAELLSFPLVGTAFGILFSLMAIADLIVLRTLLLTQLLIVAVFLSRFILGIFQFLKEEDFEIGTLAYERQQEFLMQKWGTVDVPWYKKMPWWRVAYIAGAGTMRFTVPSFLAFFEFIPEGRSISPALLAYMPLSMLELFYPVLWIGKKAYVNDLIFDELLHDVEEEAEEVIERLHHLSEALPQEDDDY